METPSAKNELKELILESLKLGYMAQSCKDGIQTGNHYQSVTLGNEQTSGFRTDREEFLDQIDFEGKKVLDLGSNLGELSRAARARGACLVDGFEYDQYFLEISSLVNAYNETSRVSFHRRDATDPSIYSEHYDIVLAFSVFTYISSVLEQIAEITDQLLVLETHKLEENLESSYLTPVLRYFPHYEILGESEWGTQFDARGKRAVIVFAKHEPTLVAALKGLRSAEAGAISNDVAPAMNTERSGSDTAARYVDVKRTCLQHRFFSNFEFDTVDELLAAAAGMHLDLDAMAWSRDLRSYVYSGWVYWLLYVKGYLQYVESGTIGSGNIYYDYLTKYYGPRAHDPGLHRVLADPQRTFERVAWRFRDTKSFREHATEDSSWLDGVAPVRIIIGDPPPQNGLLIYEIGSDAPLKASLFDGWHRLFSASLWGIEKLRCEVVRETHAGSTHVGIEDHADTRTTKGA